MKLRASFLILIFHAACFAGHQKTTYSESTTEQTVCEYIENGRLRSLPSFVDEYDIPLEELIRAGEKYKNDTIVQAAKATEKMLALPSVSKKLKKALLKIALFIQTKGAKIKNSSKHYWPKQVFGLELEADLNIGKFFIHLPNIPRYRLGTGRKKIVTKTIIYDVPEPKIAAYGATFFKLNAEADALKALQNTPHLLSAIGFLQHTDSKTGKNVNGVITQLCDKGSLSDTINYGNPFTFEQKLHIAKDCITGLEALHAKGFVHRDVHLRNFFLYTENNSIRACLGDFGRTILIKNACHAVAQGNVYVFPPEGIFPEKMFGTDYILSDLFAYGSTMWKLFYEKMPGWSYKKFSQQSHLKKHERYNLLRNAIIQEHKNLQKRIRRYSKNSIHVRLAKLLIKWTNPDPKKRGTSTQAKEEMTKLVKTFSKYS